ncbi:JAB domain-containing protein [Termitidicoccus mucosus]|uniref:JAB domain-containing protein n=1 Tax=Termitidicoccus mucosus TaxID=1184151 RepID=UPI003183F501
MRIYEIKLTYNLIQSGPAEALNCAAKVVAYMQGAFDAYPEQEMCYLICLNRKLKPTARIMITLGTQSASLLTPREFYRAAIAASASTAWTWIFFIQRTGSDLRKTIAGGRPRSHNATSAKVPRHAHMTPHR